MNEQSEPRPITCEHCSRNFSFISVTFDDFNHCRADYSDTVGYVCRSCGVSLCKDCCEQNGIHFSTWSGWEKAICVKCGEPFKPKGVFLPSDKPHLTEPAEDDDFSAFSILGIILSIALLPVKKHPRISVFAAIAVLASVFLWIGLDYRGFKHARRINTARSYEAYLEEHRHGRFRDKAVDWLTNEYPSQCGKKLREAFFGSPESISKLRMMTVYQAIKKIQSDFEHHDTLAFREEWTPFLESWLTDFDVFVSGMFYIGASDIGRIEVTRDFLDAIGLSDWNIEACNIPVIQWESQHREIETRLYQNDFAGGFPRVFVTRRRVESKMLIKRERVTLWEETSVADDPNFPFSVLVEEGTKKVFLSKLSTLEKQTHEALLLKGQRELRTPYRPLIADCEYSWKYDVTNDYYDHTDIKMEKQFLAIACAQILLGWDSRGTRNLESLAMNAKDPHIEALAGRMYYGEYDQFPDTD